MCTNNIGAPRMPNNLMLSNWAFFNICIAIFDSYIFLCKVITFNLSCFFFGKGIAIVIRKITTYMGREIQKRKL